MITVNLLDGNGNLLQTTTTDNTGFYEFTDLVPGDCISLQQSLSQQRMHYQLCPESPVSPMRIPGIVNLDSGENDDTVDAGSYNIIDRLSKTVDNTTERHGRHLHHARYQWLRGATGVTVEDQLPSGYTFVQRAYATTDIWTIGGLAEGDGTELKFTARRHGYTNNAMQEAQRTAPCMGDQRSHRKTTMPLRPVTVARDVV